MLDLLLALLLQVEFDLQWLSCFEEGLPVLPVSHVVGHDPHRDGTHIDHNVGKKLKREGGKCKCPKHIQHRFGINNRFYFLYNTSLNKQTKHYNKLYILVVKLSEIDKFFPVIYFVETCHEYIITHQRLFPVFPLYYPFVPTCPACHEFARLLTTPFFFFIIKKGFIHFSIVFFFQAVLNVRVVHVGLTSWLTESP